MRDEPEWEASGTHERKALYRAVRRVMEETGLTLLGVIERAEGHPVHVGTGYDDNFRSGRISRRRAHHIYQWLARHHPARAAELDAEIGQGYADAFPHSLWERVLATRGVFGQLRLHEVMMQQQRQVQVQTEPIQARTRVAQPFRLVLGGSHRGHALGFQWIKGRWMPLPLTDSALGIRLDGRAPQFPSPQLPYGPGNLWRPYYIEYSDAGLRRMVVALVPDSMGIRFEAAFAQDKLASPELLDAFAAEMMALEPESWSLFRLNAVMLETTNHGEYG